MSRPTPDLEEHLRRLAARPKYYILDAQGDPRPVEDVLEWARWMDTARREGRLVIAHDRDEQEGSPDVLVSTVFLGLDHEYFGGPPVLWETMVFGGLHDGYQQRYTSREAALQGHQIACALVSEAHQ